MRSTNIAMEPAESLRDHIFPIQPKLVVNHVINTLVNLKIGPSSRSLKSVSLWLLKNVFWFAIYLLGCCLTIWLCLLLFNDYSRPDNILTRVTADTTNTVMLPNITVCVPFNTTAMFPFNSSSATPYSDSIEDFFNKTIENGRFNTTKYTEEWNSSPKNILNETLFILHEYLAIMHEAEYLHKAIDYPLANFSWQNESNQNNALLNILVPRIQKMNITTDEIKKVFIEYFKIGSTVDQGNSDGGVLFCIYDYKDFEEDTCTFFDSISYLDHNQICFKMSSIFLQVADTGLKFVTISINDNSEAIKMTGRKIVFNFDEAATPPNFADTADESSIIEMIPGDDTRIYIDYENAYHGLPVMSDGKVHCSHQTRRECKENCRADFIKAMCGCTPVTFSTGGSDENKCTFAHYAKCLNYSGSEDDECQKNCPVSCEHSNYKVSTPYRDYTDYLSYSKLHIKLNSYDYLIYEEYFKWTFTDLISAIGGALGIGLGIDFIVLIRFIFALVAKVFHKVFSLANLEVATSEDNQSNINESMIKKIYTALNIEIPLGFTRVSLIMWSIGKVLWALTYLVGGVFTAISCFQLYKQYANGEMKTSMHVNFNRSISLPPSTLCLTLNISYYNINPTYAPSSNYTDALNDYLNQRNISKESIIQIGGDGSSWPHVMVYVVYKYLSVLYYYEYHNEYEGRSDKNKYPINEWLKYLSYEFDAYGYWAEEYCRSSSISAYTTTDSYAWWWGNPHGPSFLSCQEEIKAAHNLDCANAIENVLIPKLTELDITLEELRQKTLYQLNTDAQLTFRPFGSNTSTVISNLRAAALSFFSYCMQIPLENFEYTSENDYAEIAIESNKTIDKEARYDPIIFTFDTTFADLGGSISTEGEEREQTKVGSIFQIAFGDSKSFSLRINYKMALEPNPVKCINAKSMEEWNMLHRIQYIEELCNCFPASWPEFLPSASRMCTLQQYKTCLIFNESSWFYVNRGNNISMFPCEKIKVDITHNDIHNNDINMTNTSVSRIRIRVEDFVYLTIEEEMEMTFVQFAVAFGGTLGILLGLDFRFIAWLIFTPPFFLISYLLKKLLYKKAFFAKPMKNTKLKKAFDAKFARLITGILDHDLSDILKLSKFAFIKKMIINVYWLIYFTAGGILTVLLFISVVINFMRNNDAKVTFKPMNNEPISLPSPTICLPFFPLKIDSDHGKSNISSTNFIQNYLSGKTKADLLDDEWNPALINYMHSYIVQYGKYEWFSFDDFPKNMDHSASFDVAENMTNIMDITFEELREKFGMELARMYQLNITYNASISNNTIKSINTTTVFVEESNICYKTLMKSLTFNSLSSFLKITANGELIRNSRDRLDHWVPITIDLNGSNTSKKGATILDATVLANVGENTTVALEIDTIIKAYPLVGGETRCSEFLSLTQCRSSCVAETIQHNCKCLPRTITLTTSSNENAQFCTLAHYKKCNSYFKSEAFACLDGCLEPCERIRFSTWSSNTTSTLENVDEVEVNLRIRSFKYQYMEEQLMYTTEEFIGEIGGALGLFLGLSVLMFIEFFYALFVRLFDFCVTKKWAKVQPVPELDENINETSL